MHVFNSLPALTQVSMAKYLCRQQGWCHRLFFIVDIFVCVRVVVAVVDEVLDVAVFVDVAAVVVIIVRRWQFVFIQCFLQALKQFTLLAGGFQSS